MSSKMYEHFILIHPSSNFDFHLLDEKIKNVNWDGKELQSSFTENTIQLSLNGWGFHIGLSDADHVILESEEMANDLGKDHVLYSKIKSCKIRLEISGDSDFDMEYFNDFCYILEEIESFTDVYTFNPHEGFMNL